jgi:hypothetical protein
MKLIDLMYQTMLAELASARSTPLGRLISPRRVGSLRPTSRETSTGTSTFRMDMVVRDVVTSVPLTIRTSRSA